MRLQELKKLSDRQLYEMWKSATFPFDAAKCCICVTGHGAGHCKAGHIGFEINAKPIYVNLLQTTLDIGLRHNLDEIYALRLFYRDLYEKSVPAECDDPKCEGEIAVKAK